jgi:hypothetical protein
MIYTATSSGGSEVSGDAAVTKTHPTPTYVGNFVPGDVLYNVAKARKGVLERVVIKSVRAVTNRKTLGVTAVLYEDTFNGLWNEWDLVRREEAIAVILNYQAKLQDSLDALKGR